MPKGLLYQKQNPTSTKGEAPANDKTKWIDIDKTFGPIALHKIGFKYEDGAVWALINVDFLLGPLVFSLQGLKVGCQLKFPPKGEDFSVGIDGLGLRMDAGPVSLTGAFMKTPTAATEEYYQGLAILTFMELTIEAFGGYGAMPNGDKAVFVFASVNYPFGGPPFFFIKGFSLGFGYNMNLDLPKVEELSSFPLLNTSLFLEDKSPTEALTKLSQYIYPHSGGLWFAAGIKFSTFEVIDSSAMLIVDIGKIQISVLGLSVMELPKIGYAFVSIKLGIMVVVNIREGFFKAVLAVSDDSHVVHSECKVFGGVAFCSWFKGKNQGDFLFSVGGYHPRFKKPNHYPDVQRVGMSWMVNPLIRVGGNVYFTLTPSAVMAGFRFEAIFKAGPIKAWFVAIADFLIQWKPFYYDIFIGIRIGVKVGILEAELGVSLLIYGPPVGGIATVDLAIAEFDIEFGQQREDKPKLMSWENFDLKYLPQPEVLDAKNTKASSKRYLKASPKIMDEVCRVNISSGLLKKAENKNGQEVWLVRADEFMMTTESVIPIHEISLSFYGDKVAGEKGESIKNPINSKLGIRPMGVTNLYYSHHEVKITNLANEIVNWKATAKTNAVPAALWATTPVKEKVPEAEKIPATVGLRQIVAVAKNQPPATLTRIGNFKYVPVTNRLILSGKKEFIHSELFDMPAESRSQLITDSILSTKEIRNELIDEVNTFFGLDEQDRIAEDLENLGKEIDANYQSIPRIGRIKSSGKIGIQDMKKVPFEEPIGFDGEEPVYFKLRKVLSQYGNISISDFTKIQKELSKTEFRIDTGTHVIFDAYNVGELNKQIHFAGGQPFQYLSFDGLNQLNDVQISADKNFKTQILPDTRHFIFTGLPNYNNNFFVCGWTKDYHLPVANNLALVGEQFILRPQAPMKNNERSQIGLKEMLAQNIYLGDEGKNYNGWLDTQFFNDRLREIVILVKVKKQKEGLKNKIRVTVPQICNNKITEINYEPNVNLKASNTMNDGMGITRIRYKIPNNIRPWKMLTIRVQVPDEFQEFWEIQGVLGLCGKQNLSAQAWKKSNLTGMTNAIQSSNSLAPILKIT